MSLSLRIAWRYFKRPSDRLISSVGLASILGLVIGVMALVISMALMTGYRMDLQKKLLGGNAELFLYSVAGNIENTPSLLSRVRTVDGVADASPAIFQQGLITSEARATGEQIMIKGIVPARTAASKMYAQIVGERRTFVAPDGSPGIAIGTYLARKLKVSPGNVVTITVPTEHSGTFLPRAVTLTVTNVYATGFYEFDARWSFVDFGEASKLFRTNGNANLVEFKLKEGASLDKVSAAIADRTEHRFGVTDWRQMNRQLFMLLNVQQLVLFIVLGLIVFVSTFNIVSTLIMTVHEKRQEIGILLSMGGDRRLIRRIFVWYGSIVGAAGTFIGIALGTIICWIITRYELVSFGPEIAQVYFVSSIPFITRFRDLAIIAGFAVFVSFLATLLPSLRASRLNPVDALRHD